MATFPARSEILEKVCSSIINQVDHLYIYFNDYDESSIPTWAKVNSKITWQSSATSEYGDLGDVGKFYFLFEENRSKYQIEGFAFTCDDDILYPKWYVHQQLRTLSLNKFKNSLLTYHGSIFKKDPKRYHKDREVFHICKSVPRIRKVDVGGTGCMSFNTQSLPISRESFKHINMSDIFIAKEAVKNNIPIYVLPHKEGDFLILEEEETIFRSSRNKDGSSRDKSKQIEEEISGVNWMLS